MRIWKEVLLPGRQRTAAGEWFAFTPADVRRAAANCAKMLSRGVPLPCVWEHQDVEAGDPAEHRARYARHTFGHIAGQRVNARGALELLHVVPDPADARQLKKTRFVSPKVYPGYSDSRGGEYRGATIAHVAATPVPAQTWQRPFALSRRGALYLSYTPGDRPMADETKDDKGGGGTGGGGTGGGDLSKLIEALKGAGLNIPDEVTDVPGLIIAVKASGGAGGDDLGLDDDEEDLGGAGTADTQAAPGGAPMLMSDARAEPLRKATRRDLEHRAQALFRSGRVDRPTAEKLVREARSVSLSFTAAGDLTPTKLVARIEAYEELPKGSVWSRTGGKRPGARELSDTRGVDAPDPVTGKKDLAATTDWLCQGLPAKK